MVFAQLKCNDEILVPDDEFASVMLPALVSAEARGVTVRRVGFPELSSEVRGSTTIVATSHVRSRDGRVQDLAAVAEAASRVGAAVLVDATHSGGILPIWASRLGLDYVVCAAYKHLLCPRGVAFMSVREAAWGKVLPAAASWRSAADPYAHYYGPDLPVLSRTAAQYDVSLGWHAWVGAVPSLEFLRSVEAGQRQQWVVGLAKNLADHLGLPETRSSIVTVPVVDGAQVREALGARRIKTSGRGHEVRVSFHLYNDDSDVANVAEVLLPFVRI